MIARVFLVSALFGMQVCAQVTERVSVDSGGTQANFGAEVPWPVSTLVSADGRFVAFMSGSSNLIPGDTNGRWDVFVRDRLGATTEIVSVDSFGQQGNGNSGLYGVAVSAEGRYVVFESQASNLVVSDANGARDVFIRDRLLSATDLISIDSNGAQGNAGSLHPCVTPDGRYVAFFSDADNLVPGDTNGQPDVFLRDRVNGTTELLSTSTGGVLANGVSDFPVLSADGRFVAFVSDATNLGPADTNGRRDVFLRDRQLGITTRISRSSAGVQGNGNSSLPAISADGQFVAYSSDATNLVAGDTNGRSDVFLYDRLTATTTRISVAADGSQGDGNSSEPFFSADSRYLAFESSASNLIHNPPPTLALRIYVRDQSTGAIELVSVASSGSNPTNASQDPCLSADGRYVVFRSDATDLVQGDTNASMDVFLHDRFAAGFTTLCDPGHDSVIPCPCANAPASIGRGCDNSGLTGGAQLSASGVAYLSIDSLVFDTNSENSTATSILMQGDAFDPAGIVFGQGVRCVSGVMKRLYAKTAANGKIHAPDLGAGDSSVSARSALLGDPILPGETRYYVVYYRDPIVQGGCTASATFNATQTGSIAWWP